MGSRVKGQNRGSDQTLPSPLGRAWHLFTCSVECLNFFRQVLDQEMGAKNLPTHSLLLAPNVGVGPQASGDSVFPVPQVTLAPSDLSRLVVGVQRLVWRQWGAMESNAMALQDLIYPFPSRLGSRYIYQESQYFPYSESHLHVGQSRWEAEQWLPEMSASVIMPQCRARENEICMPRCRARRMKVANGNKVASQMPLKQSRMLDDLDGLRGITRGLSM